MSVKVSSLIWSQFPSGGHELLAMLALADWANDQGECYPSMSTIAARLRVSRSQAQRTVHTLIAAGMVEVIGNHAGGSPGASRRYRINLAALELLPSLHDRGRTNATGSTDVTGSMETQDGPHGCIERGRTHAARTVKEPSMNRVGVPNGTLSSPESENNTASIESHTKSNTSKKESAPVAEIVALYNHELGGVLPRAITLNASRKRAISARWREMLNSSTPAGQIRYVSRESGLDWWAKFFRKVQMNPHWLGENDRGWTADLDWLTAPRNFTKVLEFRPVCEGERR